MATVTGDVHKQRCCLRREGVVSCVRATNALEWHCGRWDPTMCRRAAEARAMARIGIHGVGTESEDSEFIHSFSQSLVLQPSAAATHQRCQIRVGVGVQSYNSGGGAGAAGAGHDAHLQRHSLPAGGVGSRPALSLPSPRKF